MSIRALENTQPATSELDHRARPKLPDRPPLRPAAYLESLRATEAPAPRRASAALGTTALIIAVAVTVATALAVAIGGVWLVLSRLAG